VIDSNQVYEFSEQDISTVDGFSSSLDESILHDPYFAVLFDEQLVSMSKYHQRARELAGLPKFIRSNSN
jgi:hypothetical protein